MDREEDEERWLEVLAGRGAAESAATRQAAAMRSEFERMAQLESEMTDNPEGEARLLKFLRDSGTFDEPVVAAAAAAATPAASTSARPVAATPAAAPAAAAPAGRPSTSRPAGLLAVLAAARDWLLPPGSGYAGRYALVAAIALAVVAGPLLLNRSGPADDATTIKSGAPSSPVAVQVLTSPRPDEAAARLVGTLSALGIAAGVTPEGDDRRIEATVPAGSIAAAQQGLAAAGLGVPPGGKLNVLVRKATP